MIWTEDVVGRFEAGEISREIALARLLLSGEVPDPASLPAPLAAFARAHGERLDHLAGLAREGFDADDVEGAARLFDGLAETAPEAGVAFYTLGDPALLAEATGELTRVIRDWVPVEGRRVLDFGCGIGRVSAALAPFAREVIGIDVSTGMVAQARARASASNLRFEHSDGRTLPLPDASIDVAIAADSFPFLVRAGVLDESMAEFARVIASGGDLLVFNWSYRGDDPGDDADARRVAERFGFDPVRIGERPFRIWDGRGFHLRRR